MTYAVVGWLKRREHEDYYDGHELHAVLPPGLTRRLCHNAAGSDAGSDHGALRLMSGTRVRPGGLTLIFVRAEEPQ